MHETIHWFKPESLKCAVPLQEKTDHFRITTCVPE